MIDGENDPDAWMRFGVPAHNKIEKCKFLLAIKGGFIAWKSFPHPGLVVAYFTALEALIIE